MNKETEEARAEKNMICTEVSKEPIAIGFDKLLLPTMITEIDIKHEIQESNSKKEVNDFNNDDIGRDKELEERKEEKYSIVIKENNECNSSEFNEITFPMEITETNIKQEIQESNFKKDDKEASLSSTSNVEPPNLGNIESTGGNIEHIDGNGDQSKPSSVRITLCMEKFKCEYCEKIYNCKNDLIQHKYGCDLERQFPCHICNYRAKRRWGLTAHINNVHTDNEFKCKVCNKGYKYKASLEIHKKFYCGQERQQGQFACNICNYRAKQKHMLVNHINDLHTVPQNKYKCEACEKVYKHKRSLNSHKKYGCVLERLFPCHICNYSAKHKFHLAQHIKGVHKEKDIKKFECESCHNSYKYKRTLMRHKKLNCGSEKESFQCHICNYTAKSKVKISSHYNSLHNLSELSEILLPMDIIYIKQEIKESYSVSELSEILLPMENTETDIKEEINEGSSMSDKETSLSSTNNTELPNFGNIEIKEEQC